MTAPILTTADHREEMAQADLAKDDRRLILAACQLLACADVGPAERVRVLRTRAEARLRCSHHAAAIDDWTRILSIRPNDYSALSHRGAALYLINNPSAALADFIDAEVVGGPAVNDMIWRGACRFRLGDKMGARSDLKAACAIEPANAAAWEWRASICDPGDDDLPGSLVELKLAMAALPGNSGIRQRTAQVLVALGRHEEALAELDVILDAAPDDDVQLYRSEVRERAGQVDAAISDLRAVVARSRRNTSAHEALIALLRRIGRLNEALGAAEDLARAVKHWRAVDVFLGEILAELGQTAAAADAFRAAWEAAPWDRAVGEALAQQLIASEDPPGALNVLEQLLRQYFTPSVARAYAGLLHSTGRSGLALERLDEVIERDADDLAALAMRAEIRRAVGRIKEARMDRDTLAQLQRQAGG